MNKIIRLKYGISLVVMAFPFETIAQTCATPPSCVDLGYSQSASDCSGQQMLKCPFDNAKVFCGGVASATCDAAYKFTCTGVGESGYSIPCNSKFTSCNCSGDYVWNGEYCEESCADEYKYECRNGHWSGVYSEVGGLGESCAGYYKECQCESGWTWDPEEGACWPDSCSNDEYQSVLGCVKCGKYGGYTCPTGTIDYDYECRTCVYAISWSHTECSHMPLPRHCWPYEG